MILRRMNKIKWLRLLSGCIHSYLCIPILRLRRELGLWGTLNMIILMLVALYSEPERRPPLQAGQGPSVQSQRHDNRLHKTLTKKQWSQQLSDFVRDTSLTTSSNYKQELHLIRKFWTLSIILILCILNIVTYFSIVTSVFWILTGTSWILKNAFIRAAKSFAQWHNLSKSQSNSLQCSLATKCGTQNIQNKICF